MQLARHFVLAQRLQRLRDNNLAAIHRLVELLRNSRGDLGRRDRTEEATVIGSTLRDRHAIRSLDGVAHSAGILDVRDLTATTRTHHVVNLTLGLGRPRLSHAARHQVVTGITRSNRNDVTRGTKVIDVSGKNDLRLLH